eukprot:6305409-Alexandrium_andersonii.AAC.1
MRAISPRTSWSFFSGIVTRTPSGVISKWAPTHRTAGPADVLCQASGYPTIVAQRSAMPHSCARSLRVPP